jgi:hypothetical protein
MSYPDPVSNSGIPKLRDRAQWSASCPGHLCLNIVHSIFTRSRFKSQETEYLWGARKRGMPVIIQWSSDTIFLYNLQIITWFDSYQVIIRYICFLHKLSFVCFPHTGQCVHAMSIC